MIPKKYNFIYFFTWVYFYIFKCIPVSFSIHLFISVSVGKLVLTLHRRNSLCIKKKKSSTAKYSKGLDDQRMHCPSIISFQVLFVCLHALIKNAVFSWI